MEGMENAVVAAVRRALEDAGLARAGAALVCALSGGADSVALLLALCELRGALGFRLAAAHVEHGLRGASSRAEVSPSRPNLPRTSSTAWSSARHPSSSLQSPAGSLPPGASCSARTEGGKGDSAARAASGWTPAARKLLKRVFLRAENAMETVFLSAGEE